jgi:ribonuclease BN (tRNA processing enzyme)
MNEPAENYIHFLGSAGARWAMATQARSTAGTFLRLNGTNILLDCGPGTLVRCTQVEPKIDLFALDGIILTHGHIDHSADVNCLVDSMTGGGIWKRGVLFAQHDCLEGEDRVVLRYFRPFLERVETLHPSTAYTVGGVSFRTSLPHDHRVETCGIHFELPTGQLSFLIDTAYFDGLIDEYRGAETLVVNVVRSNREDAPHALHLCMEEVAELLTAIRPRRTILTHFGMRLLESDPDRRAMEMADALGMDIAAAHDGMIEAL